MLPKVNRLKRDKDFQKVFKKTTPGFTANLSFRVFEINQKNRESIPSRFGFIISNKINKNSTRRNALKRQLREIVRSLISELKSGYDVIVSVRRDFSFPYSQEDIKNQIVDGLGRKGLFK